MFQLNSRYKTIIALALMLMIAGCSQGADPIQPEGTIGSESDEVNGDLIDAPESDIELSESCLDGDGISLCTVTAGEAVTYQNVVSDASDFNPVALGDSIALIANLGGSPAGSVGFTAAFIEGPGVITLDLVGERAQLSPEDAEEIQLSDLVNTWQSQSILQSDSGSLIDPLPVRPGSLSGGILLVPFSGPWNMTNDGFVFQCPALEGIESTLGGFSTVGFSTDPTSATVGIDANLSELMMLGPGVEIPFSRALGTVVYTGSIPITDSGQQVDMVTTLNVISSSKMNGMMEILLTPDCGSTSNVTLEYTGDPSQADCQIDVSQFNLASEFSALGSGGALLSEPTAGCFDECSDGMCSRDFGDRCEDVSCPTDQVCYQGGCFDDIFLETTIPDDPCQDVTCPTYQVCFEGGCFDPTNLLRAPRILPCDDVTCPADQICVQGGCYDQASLPNESCEDVSCPTSQICYDGSCFDSCVLGSDYAICGSEQTVPACTPDCEAAQACVSGICVSDDVLLAPFPLEVSISSEPPTPPGEGLVSIEVIPVQIENPASAVIEEIKVTYSYMVLSNAAFDGDPDRPFADSSRIRVYRVDPVSQRQTLWTDVTLSEEGVGIEVDRSGLFVVYLFDSAESAEGAPSILAPIGQADQ